LIHAATSSFSLPQKLQANSHNKQP